MADVRVDVGARRGPPEVRAPARAEPPPRVARPPRPPRRAAPEAPPGVDPRIAARRVEVRRGEGRKRLYRVGALGVVVLLVVGAYGATRTPLLDVDHITLEGLGQTAAADVLAAASAGGVARGEPLLDVHADQAAEAVERLPWVQSAEVRRDWPGDVAIAVVERVPAAVVAAEGGWAVVATDGVVVAVGPAPVPGLVEVRGVPAGAPGSRVDAGELLRVAAALPEGVRGSVAAVEEAADGAGVDLVLAGEGARVVLGPPTELEAKLVAVATVLTGVDLTGLATLDVRVPTAPVLTRR